MKVSIKFPSFPFSILFRFFFNIELELIKTLSLVNDYYSDVNSFEERSARRRAENWGRRYNQVRFSTDTDGPEAVNDNRSMEPYAFLILSWKPK